MHVRQRRIRGAVLFGVKLSGIIATAIQSAVRAIFPVCRGNAMKIVNVVLLCVFLVAGATWADNLTGPQQNAVRSAKQYLSMQGFSRDGLIEQLSSEYGGRYERSDATVAVDSLNVDWNEQAVRSARHYLQMQGFSCQALIEQLSSSYGDGYTESQATYGARQTDACE